MTAPGPAPELLTAADIAAGMTVHHGLHVMGFGDEETSYLALGHHPARRALAAFNHHARTYWGLTDITDGHHTGERWTDRVRTGWTVFRHPDPTRGDDPDSCWYADFDTAPDTPGAIPVTWLHTD